MGALHLYIYKYVFISFILISLKNVEGSSMSTQSASQSSEVESSISDSYDPLDNPHDEFVPLIHYNNNYEAKKKAKKHEKMNSSPENHMGRVKQKSPERYVKSMPWKVKAFFAISLIIMALLLTRFMGKATAMTYAPLLYFVAFWIYVAIELMALANPSLEIYTVYIAFAVGIFVYAFNYIIDGGSDMISDLALFLMFIAAKFLIFKSIPKLWAYVSDDEKENPITIPNMPPQ